VLMALSYLRRPHLPSRHERLVGILTNRDIRFETNFGRPIHEVMTSARSKRGGTGDRAARHTRSRRRLSSREPASGKLPIVDGENKLLGLITIKTFRKFASSPTPRGSAEGAVRRASAPGDPVRPDGRTRRSRRRPDRARRGRTGIRLALNALRSVKSEFPICL